ncbi:MAG: hypothetical protein ACKVJA_03475 [Flavobacteriales bacterium]
MAKILIHNKKKSIILTLLVVTLLFSIPVILIIFYNSFFNLLIGYNYWIYIVFILFFYFIYNGVYYYKIKFDNYSIMIQSRRTLSSFFGSKVYNLEISNNMLIGFSFYESFLSVNDKLLIQIKSISGRKSAIRIPMTLLGKKRKVKLTKILNNIIQNN